jgi:hypothetical protein
MPHQTGQPGIEKRVPPPGQKAFKKARRFGCSYHESETLPTVIGDIADGTSRGQEPGVQLAQEPGTQHGEEEAWKRHLVGSYDPGQVSEVGWTKGEILLHRIADGNSGACHLT